MLKNYQDFIPKSFVFLRNYTFDKLKKDLIAGVIVGIIALPLTMAFAMASGVEPERGIFTVIIAGFLISFLGGTNVEIAGPTGAFVVIIYNTIQRHGYDGLIIATVLGGVLLILMGLFRLGSLIKFVPHPLIVGFTTGIAVAVFSSQIKDFFGLKIPNIPIQFLAQWNAYFHSFHTIQFFSTFIGMMTLIFIIIVRRYKSQIPWGVTSLVLPTIFSFILNSFFDANIETIGSKFGVLPSSFPAPHLHFEFTRFFEVMPDAITIALLAGIESLLSAVISDTATKDRHKPNCELVAQGIANITAGIFGGMPATAAIARTAANIRLGASTPIAGMFHAVVIFILFKTCSSLVGLVPLSALSAILIVVSWDMSHLSHFWRLMTISRGDSVILLSAFFLTALVDLTVAVEVGMLLAAFLFMKRMSEIKHILIFDRRKVEEGVEVYKMSGPFFFGVIGRLKDLLYGMKTRPKTFVLRMKHVPVLDATALEALKEISDQFEGQGTKFILTELQAEPSQLLKKYGLEHLIQENFLQSLELS